MLTDREYVFKNYVHAVAANDYVVNFLLIFSRPVDNLYFYV